MRLIDDHLIGWLLEGDVSVQYQVHRDLLVSGEPTVSALQRRIGREGWGARFLACQNPDGHWGRGFYQPKWTSTHYTMLDLLCLGLPEDNPQAGRAVQMMFDTSVMQDGSINFATTDLPSDVCINGMALGYASHFHPHFDLRASGDPRLHGIVDYLLRMQMEDGGWNCQSVRRKTVHGSLHTTISVLEGLLRYRNAGYAGDLHSDSAVDAGGHSGDRLVAIRQAEARGVEFMLRHSLFRSDHTGEVIRPQFLMLSYPSRWYYDILRALDYLQAAGAAYDERMAPALSVLDEKRRADGTWPLQAKHPGNVHFDMEKTGGPSRWNTLRALRVMKKYSAD